MRITPRQADIIKQVVAEQVGASASIWLFGSRADDGKRGGDIDLYIKPAQPLELGRGIAKQVAIAVRLKQLLGDQRIDIVLDDGSPQAIYQVARTQGILL